LDNFSFVLSRDNESRDARGIDVTGQERTHHDHRVTDEIAFLVIAFLDIFSFVFS
jgi:hypothetical protein